MPELKINKDKKHSFPKSEPEWVRFINDLHQDALDERCSMEAQWARNAAYYFGFQSLQYDPTLKLIRVHDGADDEYIINRIAPFIEQRKAKLIKTKPMLGVTPDDTAEVSVKGAALSEKLLKYLWKTNDMDYKLDTAILFMLLCGSSFIKTCWDASGGEPMKEEQDEEGYIHFDEETGQQKKSLIWTGNIDNYIKSAWEVLAAPGVKHCVQKSPWLIERCHLPVLEVKEKYPDFKVDLAKVSDSDSTRFEKFVSKLGFPMLGFGGDDRSKEKQSVKELDTVLVKEFWMKPNFIYEKGVLATVIGDQLVQFDEMPYFETGEYPFVKIDENKNPYGFYGISTVSRLIPIQRHYNESRTQVAKNARYMGNPKFWAAKGCGLSDEAFTDEQGEIIETNPNMEIPRQIPVAPLPNYIIESQNQDINDFRDVGNEREQSQIPFPGLTASVAMEKALEQSEIGLTPTLRYIERGLAQMGRQSLMLANKYYTDQRKMKVFGRQSGEIDIILFNNEDLADQTDVTIMVETGLSNSKSSARQQLIDLWDRRIITDAEALLKAYVTGDTDIIMRAKDPAEALVIQDIEMLKQGKFPPLSPFDNHIMYIKMISNFMQTPEFRKMPPDRQMQTAQFLQQHIQFMQPQQPMMEQNPAAVNTPFGSQVPEGMGMDMMGMEGQPAMPMA